MFIMMNAARLHVALQGLGHAEAAFQIALEYSRERVQMRAPGRTAACAPRRRGGADPIIVHPAIRHTLLRLRAYVQGERCIGYWIAHLLDLAEHDPSVGGRALSSRLASLLTPVAKSYFTETGFKMASAALQVLGGHGYLHDHAIEQRLRDSRVAMVYEGTNELQANDLLVRMVIGDNCQALKALLSILEAEAHACLSTQSCLGFGLKLRQSATSLANATMAIIADAAGDPELPYRLAQDYLCLLSIVLLAYSWARSARVSQTHASTDTFYRDKLVTAQFFFDFMLPELDYRVTLLEAGRKQLPHV
jgi:Acyl-CoA dehydrogenase, C-terminal domain/Acetyl-CoA dehydrogenase C-terminal like